MDLQNFAMRMKLFVYLLKNSSKISHY